jgi:ergothioneine biosynthesis protein EgtB
MQHTEKIILNEDIFKRGKLAERYKSVRSFTEYLCRPLEKEDYVIQPMPDASPAKWHLAHTTWFFEAFVLMKGVKNYRSLHPQYNYLFNSYYVQMGDRYRRDLRGNISRPTVDEVYRYRKYVDEQILGLIAVCPEKTYNDLFFVIETGINHEQQHQELLLTDLKNMFSYNPLHPVYRYINRPDPAEGVIKSWIEIDGGVVEIGSEGESFSYDNECPRHKKYIDRFCIGSGLITNEEYIAFIEDNGYRRVELWLSDGYDIARRENWNAPLYWEKVEGVWYYFTLSGFEKVKMQEPVCHVSFYEADAYARWRDARLPLEEEWETAAPDEIQGNFAGEKFFHPAAMWNLSDDYSQFFGDVWEWTGSAYLPYPGFRPLPGALGEYNGKFMSGQMVLRGGSCATSASHIRKTYRNFFPPHARWQFSGIRLAKDSGRDEN